MPLEYDTVGCAPDIDIWQQLRDKDDAIAAAMDELIALQKFVLDVREVLNSKYMEGASSDQAVATLFRLYDSVPSDSVLGRLLDATWSAGFSATPDQVLLQPARRDAA